MSMLSIVIPCFNEEHSLAELYARLVGVLDGLDREAEVVFVDDGSSDGSFAVLRELADADARVRPLRLLQHRGKAAALAAGFAAARGDVVVTMDADLQDDPAELPRFLHAIDAGFDLVSGYKRYRQDHRAKVLASRLFNRVVRRCFGVPLRDVNCGYKAYRRTLVRQLHPYGELHRYIPVLAHAQGARIGEIEVRHNRRVHGVSKYGLARAPKALLDLGTVLLLTRYRDRPSHFFGACALAACGGGAASCGAALLLAWLGLARVSAAWLWATAAVTLLMSTQLLATGLLAEQRRAAQAPAVAAQWVEYAPAGGAARRASNA